MRASSSYVWLSNPYTVHYYCCIISSSSSHLWYYPTSICSQLTQCTIKQIVHYTVLYQIIITRVVLSNLCLGQLTQCIIKCIVHSSVLYPIIHHHVWHYLTCVWSQLTQCTALCCIIKQIVHYSVLYQIIITRVVLSNLCLESAAATTSRQAADSARTDPLPTNCTTDSFTCQQTNVVTA